MMMTIMTTMMMIISHGPKIRNIFYSLVWRSHLALLEELVLGVTEANPIGPPSVVLGGRSEVLGIMDQTQDLTHTKHVLCHIYCFPGLLGLGMGMCPSGDRFVYAP